jgi:hypothetical protein
MSLVKRHNEYMTTTTTSAKQNTIVAVDCGRCAGTGKVIFSMQMGGRCFGCNATGKVETTTKALAAKARQEAAAERKHATQLEARLAKHAANWAEFAEAYPTEADMIIRLEAAEVAPRTLWAFLRQDIARRDQRNTATVHDCAELARRWFASEKVA